MPSIRSATGVLSLLLGCHAVPPAGECQRVSPTTAVMQSESLLLQVPASPRRPLMSALALEDRAVQTQERQTRSSTGSGKGAGEGIDDELDVSMDRAPKKKSTCSSACNHKGAAYNCRARVVWSLDVGGERNLTGALSRVNAECDSQCQCSLEDFPAAWGGQPEGEEGECYTAVEGEQCYKAVEWARTHGVRLQPSRYQGLTAGSTFEEFQAYLHKHRLEHCLRPCDACHTAEPGETCHAAVTQAMVNAGHGEDLEVSTFEEVQAVLNRTDATSSCPVPCNLCHTALPGESCFKGVRWAMQHGLQIFPDRYPGLSLDSTFEDFQAALHAAHHERCSMPCLGASPSSQKTTVPSMGTSTMPATSQEDTLTTPSSDCTVKITRGKFIFLNDKVAFYMLDEGYATIITEAAHEWGDSEVFTELTVNPSSEDVSRFLKLSGEEHGQLHNVGKKKKDSDSIPDKDVTDEGSVGRPSEEKGGRFAVGAQHVFDTQWSGNVRQSYQSCSGFNAPFNPICCRMKVNIRSDVFVFKQEAGDFWSMQHCERGGKGAS